MKASNGHGFVDEFGKMTTLRCHRWLPIALLLWIQAALHAENWPGWRGPRGDGSSTEQNIPIEWDGRTGHNIVWKVSTPGSGHSSPIVWDDNVILTSCLPASEERILLCLDRTSGETKWQRTVFRAPLESIHALNSYASGTPATDGKTIYVSFLKVDGRLVPAPNVGTPRDITPGEIVVAAYDFEGNQKWSVQCGEFLSAHGFCSCPVLYQDLLIINGDHDGDSYIVALDKRTGQQRWKVAREHKTRSYVTPIIREVNGRPQLVLSGSKQVVSLNPRDGSSYWKVSGPTEQFVASMVFDGQQFYMTCGFPDYYVMAIKPDGRGDVTDTHVAWQHSNARAYVPSPVVVGDFLLVADDRGTANCFDTQTGDRYWQARLGNGFHASLVYANGLVYFVAKNGKGKVVRPGKKLEVVAENDLGEYVSASPAVSNGQMIIRTEESLFCIGER